MRNSRLHIFQVVSILLLVFGYFLTDIPDNLSVMKFNSSASVSITKDQRDTDFGCDKIFASSSQTDKPGALVTSRHFAQELTLTLLPTLQMQPLNLKVKVHTGYKQKYRFLFFKEINPPPPKLQNVFS